MDLCTLQIDIGSAPLRIGADRHCQELYLSAILQRVDYGQGERIVDVRPNIGVENNRDGHATSLRFSPAIQRSR